MKELFCNKRLAGSIAVLLIILVAVVAFVIFHPNWTSEVKSDPTANRIISSQLTTKTDLSVTTETTDLKIEDDTTKKLTLELNNCRKNTTNLENRFQRVNYSCLLDIYENVNQFDFRTGFEAGTVNTSFSHGVDVRSQLDNCKKNNTLLKQKIQELKRRCLLFRQKNPDPALVKHLHRDLDSYNNTRDAFFVACYRAQLFELILLHYIGVDIDVKSSRFNETCLHIAARRGNVKLAQVLIDLGCDIDTRNGGGETALFISFNIEVAKLLLENGADVNALTNDNYKVLDYAKNNEDINLLKKYGAKKKK